MPSTYVVAVGAADVRRDPDSTSELVTQALMNTPVITGATTDEWIHVRLPDYQGWMRSDELGEPVVKGFCRISKRCTTALDLVAVVTATHAPLYLDVEGTETLSIVYLSTALPLLDMAHPQRVQVGLPGGRNAWLSRPDVALRQRTATYPPTPISVITAYARAFLGVPYLWGGTSWQGIDCSGLVQLCYRMGGYMLPRDAAQQHDILLQSVTLEELQEGDLIFFGRQQITHVAMALNSKEYIHAEGRNYNCVTINSFDPADADYDQRLCEIVWDTRRVGTEFMCSV
jgi:gamma-D-glutamyl-L-lysine dipeptidyl-peptidase